MRFANQELPIEIVQIHMSSTHVYCANTHLKLLQLVRY